MVPVLPSLRGSLLSRWAAVCTISLVGCGPAPAPVTSPPAPPAAPPNKPAAVAAAPSAVPAAAALMVLEEDEEGIIGGPEDDTSFDFDPESFDEAPSGVVLDGTPAPARSIARALAPYLESRRARLAGVSNGGSRMIVLTRLAEATHVHLLTGPGAARQQITFGREPIEQAAFAPKHSGLLAYRADVGGDEHYQINVLDLNTRGSTTIPSGEGRQGPLRWSPDGERIAFPSNARNGVDMDIYVATRPFSDPPRLVAELAGQNVVLGWDRSGRALLVHQFRSRTDSDIKIVTVETGAVEDITPGDGSSNSSAAFGRSGRHVYVLSDRGADTKEIYKVEPDHGTWDRLTKDAPWGIEEFAVSSDEQTIVYNRNEDGASVLRRLDTATRKSKRLRNLPTGVVTSLRFVSANRIAMTLSTPTRPPDAYTYDLATETLTRWTSSEVGGLLSNLFIEPTAIRVSSFDGLKIPAYYYRPKGTGPFPVLLWMHGGPEDQSRPTFEPVIQYFVSRGIAVLAPNVRGSDGYGTRFLSLDDGMLRDHAIRDVGAFLDWIAATPDLDADRVGIHGASYGGFMVLACLVAYGDRIQAGSDLVGVSNIVTFLENTSGYRRELRRVEYGDERDPDVRSYLTAISPLTQAHRIRTPLFVAHGARDPRVPASEAEQVVAAVRASGTEVWYMLGEDEGHSFRQRRTRDTFYRLMATFFEKHLLGATTGEAATRADHSG